MSKITRTILQCNCLPNLGYNRLARRCVVYCLWIRAVCD